MRRLCAKVKWNCRRTQKGTVKVFDCRIRDRQAAGRTDRWMDEVSLCNCSWQNHIRSVGVKRRLSPNETHINFNYSNEFQAKDKLWAKQDRDGEREGRVENKAWLNKRCDTIAFGGCVGAWTGTSN